MSVTAADLVAKQSERQKPLILISNDDGIYSKGIAALVEAVKPLGEVVVVAPDAPQSGMGHAITVHGTIKLKPDHRFGPEVKAYACSGTPADCVKLAKHLVLKDRTPDLVVSGINHGANTSISILYSGTMSAAMEAGIEWVPAIGFSLCEFGDDISFEHTIPFVREIANRVLVHGVPKATVLNVNIPKASDQPIKGIRVCRQADGFWKESFALLTPEGDAFDYDLDLTDEREFRLYGEFVNREAKAQDTDMWAIEHNYIAVVPSMYDMTDYNALNTLKQDWDVDHD